MESVIEEQEVVVRRERRSSLFFPPEKEINVDVKFTEEVYHPPDYLNKLEEEYKQWTETCQKLRNTVLNLRKELQENVKHPIDMTILDKEQQQFFRNIPTMYFSYIKTFEEFLDEVHTASVISDNITKYNKELVNGSEERLENTDKKLKEHLQIIHNKQ